MKRTPVQPDLRRVPGECNRFLDAYGRERVEPEMLRTVAAVEVFG